MASEEQGTPTEELPGQQNMFSRDDPATSKGKKPKKKGPTHLKGTRALERLRSRVDMAVKELKRLRDENHSLQKEIEVLKSRSVEPLDGTAVLFNEGPSDLRSQLESYISVIDGYIEREESTDTESTG